MAKSRAGGAAGALEEIEDSADRLAEWIREHAVWVIGAIVLCIAVGGGVSLLGSRRSASEDEAALALARAQEDYRVAMGAPAGSFDVPELANPEAASSIRKDYAARFREIAAEHEGTVGGVLARLEAASLLEAQGEPEAARTEIEAALAEASEGSRLRGVVLQRLAVAQEQTGDPAAAAASYEAAGSIEAYPLRAWALVDAARCYAASGDDARALALLERVERDWPEFAMPDYQRALLRELRGQIPAGGGGQG